MMSLPQVPKLSDSYPKKHVFETESGHFMMYDDNDATRQYNNDIEVAHNITSADGTRIDVVVSDHITGVGGSSYNVIQEDNILTVNGRCKVFINSSEVRNNHYDIVIGKGECQYTSRTRRHQHERP